MNRGGHSGHHAGPGRSVVGGIDVDTDRKLVGKTMQGRANGAQGLRQHDGRASVQQAVGLGVSLDGHGADHTISRRLDQLHSHFLAQGAHRDHFHQFVKVYRLAHVRHHD